MLTNKDLIHNVEAKSNNQDFGVGLSEKGMSTISPKDILRIKNKFYPNWKEFVCGCGAACINISVTFPINKLIFRQMLHGIKAYSAFRELHKEGYYYLYRGILPPLLQKSLSLSVMFGVYEEVRRPLINAEVNPYITKTLAGLVSGTMEAVFTPFERIQTLLQDSSYHQNFKNTFDAFKVIGISYGLKEYYRGVHTILLRNGPANVCFFISRDELQSRMPHTDSNTVKTLMLFVCGACLGSCISALIYPLNVAKVATQSKLGGEFESIFTVLPRLYRARGSKLKYLYRGVHANCTRSFLSWGVMNAAYENIKKLLY